MQVTVECHGVLSELCGAHECWIELAGETADVTRVLAALADRVPALRDYLPRVACARGDALIARDAPVADGDRLALIPPVSGG